MKQRDRLILAAVALFPILRIHTALAQVIPDRTTGTSIKGTCTSLCTIEGGTHANNNLFHSFRSFSIPTGGTVRFIDPGVTNILVRITGSDRSTLRGTLSVDGGANLFLLNPNGILFGEKARLDVKGSFVATTADALRFGDHGVFSASRANSPTPLTVNPSAFLFNQIASGQTGSNLVNSPIENRSTATQEQDRRSGLWVPADRSLVLLGGDIHISGSISSPGSHVELGGLVGKGEVGLRVADRLRLQFPQVPQSSIYLDQNAFVDVGGGRLGVRGRSLTLSNASSLNASALEDQAGGNIVINIQDQVLLTDSTISSDSGRARGAGKIEVQANRLSLQGSSIYAEALKSSGGSIRIQVRSLILSANSTLSTTTSGGGEAGQIAITAEDSVRLEGSSIVSNANLSSTRLGNAGRIQIQTHELQLNGSSLSTSVDDTGQQRGQGGNIELSAHRVSLRNESKISATTGSTDGGNITLRNANLLFLNGQSSLSTSAGTAQKGGNGGAIDLQSQLVVADPLTNNDITANAYAGSGGSIRIDGYTFGLTPRNRDDLRRLLNTDDPTQLDPVSLSSSDITAISQTQPDTRQSVNLDTTNLSRLVTLPSEAIDAARLISRNCRTSSTRSQGAFIITGRGGLPPSPSDSRGSAAVLTDWAALQDGGGEEMGENLQVGQVRQVRSATPDRTREKTHDSYSSPLPLIEAQGWVIDPEGKVTLRSEVPNAGSPSNITSDIPSDLTCR